MNIRHILLGSVLALALPLAAQAETNGFYISGSAGADFGVDASASTTGGSNVVRYDIGPAVSASIGYGFGPFRAEVEEAYSHNDVSGVSGSPLNSVGGASRSWNTMFNGFYDFNTGSAFTPYIGAGVGFDLFNASLSGTRPAGSTVGVYSGSDTTFAYQGIIGVAYALTPNLSVTADYRYVASTDANISAGSNKWTVENANHVVSAGLRWSFGVAPALEVPVAAPVPPAPVTEYSLLFDWDKAVITAEAQATIAQAAAVATEVHAPVVLVAAFTDTSGSNAYNQRLSERRAAAVRRALIELGVSADVIKTVGKGETELAVPTPDDVREHLNRRAKIILRIG